MPLLLRLCEATSTSELWSSPFPDPTPHAFVPRDLGEAAARLRDADPRQLREAAELLGGRSEHDDEGAANVVARAWLDGRLTLVTWPHVVGRTDPIDAEIVDLADLADDDPIAPTTTFVEIQVVFDGGIGCAGAKVRVLTPEGDTREGTLDGDSKFRADDLEPGTCMLEFPEPLPIPDGEASEVTLIEPTGRTARSTRDGRTQLRAGATHLVVVTGPRFELAIDLGGASAWPAGSAMRLAGGPYDARIELAQASETLGLTIFHFEGVRRGVDYTLTFEPAGGDPITLVDARSLDPFLDVLGDLAAPIEPLELTRLVPPEPEPDEAIVASAGRPQRADDLAWAIASMPWDDGDGTMLA